MSVGNKSMFMFDGKWYLLSIQHVNIQPLIRIKIYFSQIDDSTWNKKPFSDRNLFLFVEKGLNLKTQRKSPKAEDLLKSFFCSLLMCFNHHPSRIFDFLSVEYTKEKFFSLLLHSKKRDFQIKLCVGIFFLLLVFSVKFNNLKKVFRFPRRLCCLFSPFPIKKPFALKMCVAALQGFVEFRALMI